MFCFLPVPILFHEVKNIVDTSFFVYLLQIIAWNNSNGKTVKLIKFILFKKTEKKYVPVIFVSICWDVKWLKRKERIRLLSTDRCTSPAGRWHSQDRLCKIIKFGCWTFRLYWLGNMGYSIFNQDRSFKKATIYQ